MLHSGWFEPEIKEYLAPNCVAEAAKDFGITDDRVRLALAEAAVRQGQKVGRWEISAAIAAKAAGLDATALLAKAKSPQIKKRVAASTKEFHVLQATQRPAFLLENNIGDRAVFSGLVQITPLAAAIDALLADAKAYAVHAAHFGPPPPD
jgi:predicted DsbA family dithiol-disulfide isomerase